MANTNIEIKALKDIKHFNQRKYENNRQTNIKGVEDKFINIVEIINDKIGQKPIIEKKEDKTLHRSDLTRLISSYNAKVNKCKNELNQLNMKYYECDSDLEKDKIKKKIDKKKDSLNNFKEKVKDFTFLKNGTPPKKPNHKNDNRNEFYELRFSITNPPKKYRRNQEYGKDLLNIVKEYIKNKKLDIDIHSFSLHMDQHSPHIHLLGSMNGKELTLNQQLEKIFEKRFSYHSLQKDFNNFVKEHSLMKKYEIKIGDITRGGVYEYDKNLMSYKSKTKGVEEKVEKYLKNIQPTKKFGFVVETREQKLENILKPLLIEKHSHKELSKNIEKDLIRSDKIISNVLNEKQKIKYDYNDVINDLNTKNKELKQQLNLNDQKIDDIVKDKLSKYQNQINDTFGKQNKKIKEYESYIQQLEIKVSELEDRDTIDR